MVLGRAGMKLEAQKFAVYLSIPIMASLAFNEPSVQKWAADYFQFMKYPSNPKTNLMKEFEQLQREREEEIEEERRMQEKRIKGREEYLAQMKLLNSSRGDNAPGINNTDSTSNNKSGWFGWMRGWRRGGES
mmetsp:Transcript_34357/g.51499  ORF Transcript_34357/g.51499 Transcript_34357/m.51499 type:complete len:132 (+) Transcript_34357:131-526(+)|eukprot:scaffold3706_cov124-Skeletonema_dohrnii-CCMP3373.AAC.7